MYESVLKLGGQPKVATDLGHKGARTPEDARCRAAATYFYTCVFMACYLDHSTETGRSFTPLACAARVCVGVLMYPSAARLAVRTFVSTLSQFAPFTLSDNLV